MAIRDVVKIAIIVSCFGIVVAQPVFGQSSLFLKSDDNAQSAASAKKAAPVPSTSGKTQNRTSAAPSPQQASPELSAPMAKCTKAELEAFVKVDNLVMGNARYAEEVSKKGLSEAEAEEFAKEMEERQKKIQELIKRPGFLEKYAELSIRCHVQAQALRK